jgi:hypothetical protein
MEKRAPSHPEKDAEEEKRKRPSEPPGHECRGESDEEFGQDDSVFQGYGPPLNRFCRADVCLPTIFAPASSEVTHGSALGFQVDDSQKTVVYHRVK